MYNEAVARQTDYTKRTIARLDIDPECTILDIGTGPGTLAIPLAKIVKHVTAIDPSKGMLDCLRENARREELGNITCINKKWEEVELENEIEGYDIVIASNSLVMLDIKEALWKMDHAAKRSVYLFRFAGKQTWDYGEIWPLLYGEEFIPGPDYIYIVNVLHQMGIYANIETWDHGFSQRFSSLDKAVKEMLGKFVDPPVNADRVIREYLSKTLVKEEGALWSKRKTRAAMIWWKKEK